MGERVFGVDEAGKGPVLGSMFAAAVVADPAAIPAGVDDSKALSPERREALAADLQASADVAVGVAEVPVERIDDPETDMNTLTVAAHAEALAAVGVDLAGLSGVVDAGDTDAARFGRRVRERLAEGDPAPGDGAADCLDLRAEHGADESHPAVSAASVVAKVQRDAHVETLAESHGTDLGSGYPSDPATRDFLREHVREHGRLPDCARASWATSRDALAAAEQSALDEF